MSLNRTKIEWTQFTFNPVVGCKNGCWYCYAKRMNDRFKWIKEWSEPGFFPQRLSEPYKLKKSSKIFVGSMCDLFGDWIPDRWIKRVIKVAEENPRHTFQFLTKNPKRYLEFDFPKNCWLGATIDGTEVWGTAQSKINDLKLTDNYKFISFEPLLGDVSGLDLTGIDLVIVGAQTGRGAIPPKKEWIDSIKHSNILFKDNLLKIYPEYAKRKRKVQPDFLEAMEKEKTVKCPNCKQEMIRAWKWKKWDYLCPYCGYEKKVKPKNKN